MGCCGGGSVRTFIQANSRPSNTPDSKSVAKIPERCPVCGGLVVKTSTANKVFGRCNICHRVYQ